MASYGASLADEFMDVDGTRVSTLLEAVKAALAAWRASRSTAVIALSWRWWHTRFTALSRQPMLLLYPTITCMARHLLATCHSVFHLHVKNCFVL